MKTKLTKQQLINQLNKIDLNNLSSEVKEYRDNFLKIGTIQENRGLYVYLLDNKKIEKIEKNYINIANALKKLTQYIINNPKSKLVQTIGLNKLDIKSINSRNKKYLMTYARIDSLYNSDAYKTVEFNARRPQMYEDADWFNNLIMQSGIKNVEYENNTQEIIKATLNLYKENTNTKPKNIVYVSNIYKEHSIYILNVFKKMLPKANFIYLKTNQLPNFYSKINLNNKNELEYEGNKIDLIFYQSLGSSKNSIYRASGRINNDLIYQAYKNNKIEIASPPSTLIFGKKHSLKLLHNKRVQSLINLNKKEIESINTIPYSRKMTSLKDLETKDLVIKVFGKDSGRGVFFTNDLNIQDKEYIKNIFYKNRNSIIVQTQINIELDEIYNLQTHKLEKAAISLEPFIINQNGTFKVNGYSTRAILEKNIQPNTKFNPVNNRREIMFGAVISHI